MTAAIMPERRTRLNRAGSAALVLLGGVFFLTGFHLYAGVARRWEEIYLKFDIKGGLPAATELALLPSHWLSGHYGAVLAAVAVVLGAVACIVVRAHSRRAWRVAGWFAVACFFVWYPAIFFLLYGIVLPFLCITWVG